MAPKVKSAIQGSVIGRRGRFTSCPIAWMLKVDAPTKTTSQPHDDWPRIGSADDGRPDEPSNAEPAGALGLRLPDRGIAGHGNNTGRKFGLQLLLRHYTPLRTKEGGSSPQILGTRPRREVRLGS